MALPKLNDSPKYAVFASILFINSEGLPFATILQFERIIALSTQFNKSLAWWSHSIMDILFSFCKLTIISCNILIVRTSNAANGSSSNKILG